MNAITLLEKMDIYLMALAILQSKGLVLSCQVIPAKDATRPVNVMQTVLLIFCVVQWDVENSVYSLN